MYNGSQIQDNNGENVVIKKDSRRKVIYCDEREEMSYWCNRCKSSIGPRKKTPERYISHEEHVLKCWPSGKRDIDFVECFLCKFAGSKITQHVQSAHGLSKEEYIEKYGPVICSASSKRYGSTDNCNWITRKKNDGEDLTTYKAKMGLAVSNAIMSNTNERNRRSNLLGSLNKRQDFRDRSSKAAKITSSRPEILEKRSARLKRWREENPEEFQKIITKSLQKSSSRPEKLLFEICKEIFGESTVSQFQVQHILIPNKTKRARIDIANKDNKILVEFDGPFHFKPILGMDNLALRIARDEAVEKYAIENDYVLIRISYDCFDGKHFNENVLNTLKECIAKRFNSCVIRIGNCYSCEK